MQGKQPKTSNGTEQRFWRKSRGLNFGPKFRPNQRARLKRKISVNCRRKLRIAPRWVINYLPWRTLDENLCRDRKNKHRSADKPILRKTAFRTDEIGPILKRNGFVLLHLRFTARRRQLTAFSGMILEIASSYGGI